MTSIGTAVLQIIPSLRGVSEAIEKQIDGKVIDVKVAPKVDPKAVEAAGKQARSEIEKQTTQVKVEPKVDKPAAERAGKTAGEAVTKGANEAVRKGDIGKTVGDEITSTVEKTSPGREVAKILVDGIADGVKGELRGGVLVDNLIDGIADGAKQEIDRGNFGGRVADSISGSIKSGNLTGKLREAVLGGINQVGDEIRSSTAEWGRGIADSLRSGDIEGATTDISTAVLNTTDIISNIGETFGLQLDGVRDFGDNAATTLSQVGGDVQGVISDALELKGTFDDVGNLLETVLPGKAGKGAAGITEKLSRVAIPAWLAFLVGEHGADMQKWAEDNIPGAKQLDGLPNVGDWGRNARDWVDNNILSETLPGLRTSRNQLPAGGSGGNGPHGEPTKVLPDGTVITTGHFSAGGFTGNWVRDQVAGVVHGGEWVINAASTASIESAWPGFLDHLNKTGRLPGYEGGGLVAGTSQLRDIIMQRFGINNIGGWRPGGDGYDEHVTGRALDVMVGNNRSAGDAVRDFVLANADAIDLKWVIWRQHLSYPGGGGYDMPDRGSPTQNHMDHVHIFSGTGIANGLRGALKGSVGAAVGATLAKPGGGLGDGPLAAASGEQTASTAAAVPSSAAGSSGGTSVPTSLSGLSRWGFDAMVSGADNREGHRDPNAYFPKAAAAAVGDQVSSALGVLGVPDSPGWLQGISKLIGGISVSDSNGRKLFDGGNIGASFGGGDGYGGAAPVGSAGASAAVPADGSVHGAYAGRGPGTVFNTQITAGDTEQAFTLWQRQMNEQSAAKLSRF